MAEVMAAAADQTDDDAVSPRAEAWKKLRALEEVEERERIETSAIRERLAKIEKEREILRKSTEQEARLHEIASRRLELEDLTTRLQAVKIAEQEKALRISILDGVYSSHIETEPQSTAQLHEARAFSKTSLANIIADELEADDLDEDTKKIFARLVSGKEEFAKGRSLTKEAENKYLSTAGPWRGINTMQSSQVFAQRRSLQAEVEAQRHLIAEAKQKAESEAAKLHQAEALLSIIHEVVHTEVKLMAEEILGPRDCWSQEVREALLDGCVEDDSELRLQIGLDLDKAMRARALLYALDDEEAPALYGVESWLSDTNELPALLDAAVLPPHFVNKKVLRAHKSRAEVSTQLVWPKKVSSAKKKTTALVTTLVNKELRVIAGTDSGTVCIWTSKRAEAAVLNEHRHQTIRCLDFDASGNYFCVLDAIGNFSAWQIQGRDQVSPILFTEATSVQRQLRRSSDLMTVEPPILASYCLYNKHHTLLSTAAGDIWSLRLEASVTAPAIPVRKTFLGKPKQPRKESISASALPLVGDHHFLPRVNDGKSIILAKLIQCGATFLCTLDESGQCNIWSLDAPHVPKKMQPTTTAQLDLGKRRYEPTSAPVEVFNRSLLQEHLPESTEIDTIAQGLHFGLASHSLRRVHSWQYKPCTSDKDRRLYATRIPEPDHTYTLYEASYDQEQLSRLIEQPCICHELSAEILAAAVVPKQSSEVYVLECRERRQPSAQDILLIHTIAFAFDGRPSLNTQNTIAFSVSENVEDCAFAATKNVQGTLVFLLRLGSRLYVYPKNSIAPTVVRLERSKPDDFIYFAAPQLDEIVYYAAETLWHLDASALQISQDELLIEDEPTKVTLKDNGKEKFAADESEPHVDDSSVSNEMSKLEKTGFSLVTPADLKLASEKRLTATDNGQRRNKTTFLRNRPPGLSRNTGIGRFPQLRRHYRKEGQQ